MQIVAKMARVLFHSGEDGRRAKGRYNEKMGGSHREYTEVDVHRKAVAMWHPCFMRAAVAIIACGSRNGDFGIAEGEREHETQVKNLAM